MHWKKWAKHGHEELEEGASIEPALVFLRKKARGDWTEKHRNVTRKIFLEGGWTQNRLFDIGWLDVSQCQACQLEESTEKHRLYHCPEWHEIRREIPEAFRKWEQKARTQRKEWKWQRRIDAILLRESQWNRGYFSVKKWKSEKHKKLSMPREGFKGHVATDSSLLGKARKWGASGWAMVQLDCDEEMEPLLGMYGPMEAEFEVQRIIKRTELTAFLRLLNKVIGPVRVHVDNKRIIDCDLWGSPDQLYKLENCGWLVGVATDRTPASRLLRFFSCYFPLFFFFFAQSKKYKKKQK